MKFYLTTAMAGLLLFSCAQNELVDSYADRGSETGNDAISFNLNLGNQTRADVLLQNAGFTNFGVWAVKADGSANDTDFTGLTLNLNDPNTLSDRVVMNNYRVQYETAMHNGSYWTYVTSEWATTPSYDQYLKYWDGSFKNTYFIGYAPHNTERTGRDVTFDLVSSVPTLTFPAFSTNSSQAENYIYSDVKKAVNSEYILAGATPPSKDKVDLKFHRIFSNVKIAIWEDIPGYKVDMVKFDFKSPGTSNNEIVAMPANLEVAANGATTWTRGEYVNAGTPKVEYSDADLATSALSMSGVAMGDANLAFELPANPIGTTYATASKSATVYNVIPNNTASQPASWTMAGGETWAKNSGLQFVMSYKLTSEDTNETITVKGARVYVPAKFTAWAPNTVYTYVFRITKDSSGTTENTDPEPDPKDPEPGLYPIIFDGVTVSTETATSEWMVNQKINLNETLLGLQPGANFNLTASEAYTDETDIPYTYTWSTSDEGVATVSATGEVTAVGAGTAVITATTKETGISASATVHVYTTTATPAPVSVNKGATTTLANPFTPDTLPVTWSSSDSMIATVSASGVVTGVDAGTATITCTLAPGVTVDFTVTVNP